MFGISHLLKKIQNRQTREFYVREIVKVVLKEVANVDMIVENIKIKDSTITVLNVGQSGRSEIYIKKHKILNLVNIRQDVIVVKDIK